MKPKTAQLGGPCMSRHMEDNLDMTLAELLPRMQHRILSGMTWFGVRVLKCPNDFWMYQEILFERRPDVIVEIGNAYGGSTLALAHLCDLLGHGRVIGVDLSHGGVPDVVRRHPRVRLFEGDACALYGTVRNEVRKGERVLVIEDSSHTFENTLAVLRTYSPLVKPRDYFIVEDSICHHGLSEGPSPGPFEAIEAFVAENPDFEIDRSREAFVVTWNPKGYLRRRDDDSIGGKLRRLGKRLAGE